MGSMHFMKTREFLNQVKEAGQTVEMLKKRIEVCESAGLEPGLLCNELEAANKGLSQKIVRTAEMIAKIPDVHHQWVLFKRYVELLDWMDIAFQENMTRRAVVNAHGYALPELQSVLVEEGVIAPEDADDASLPPDDDYGNNSGSMEDYRKYREEKASVNQKSGMNQDRERFEFYG